MKKHQQKLDPPGFWQEEFFGGEGDHLQFLHDQDEALEKHDWVQGSIDKTAATKKQILTKDYETHTYKGYALDGSFYNFWRRHHEAGQIEMSYAEFKKMNNHLDWRKGAKEGDEIHLPLGAQYIGMDDLMKLDATKNDYAVYLDKAKNLIISNPHVGYLSPQRLNSIDMRAEEKKWAAEDEQTKPSLRYLRYVVLMNDDFAFISQKTGVPEYLLKAGLEGPLQPGVSIKIDATQGNMILNFEKWAEQPKHSGAILEQMHLSPRFSDNFIHVIWMDTYTFFARVYNNDSFETVTHQFITNAIQKHAKDKKIPPTNGNNPIGDNLDEKGFADVVVGWNDSGDKHMHVYTYSSQLDRVEYKCTYAEYVQAKYEKDAAEKKRKEKERKEKERKEKEAYEKSFNKNGTVSNLPGFFKNIGNTIDEAVPYDGSKAKIEMEIKVPVYGIWVGLHTVLEAENDGGNIKLQSRLGIVVEGKLKIVDIGVRFGGYIEAQGKSGQHVMELYQFDFYQWLREKASSLVHLSTFEQAMGVIFGAVGRLYLSAEQKTGTALHMFLNGAFSGNKDSKAAIKDFAGAELWANKVKTVIKSGDYYVESGFYFKFNVAFGIGGEDSDIGGEIEADILHGNRIDKGSIENAEAKRKKEGKSVAPSESDYYPIGETNRTWAGKFKLNWGGGFIEVGAKRVSDGSGNTKEWEVEIVPSFDMREITKKFAPIIKGKLGPGVKIGEVGIQWLMAGFASGVSFALEQLVVRDKTGTSWRDLVELIMKAVAQIKEEKYKSINQGIINKVKKLQSIDGHTPLEIKNYLQLAIKYKYVPPAKKGADGKHSMEFLVYDLLKFAFDIKYLKLEIERAKPLSKKF